MISIRKLYDQAKMYMNFEEIEAIQSGSIKSYLSQFNLQTQDMVLNEMENKDFPEPPI